MLVTSGVLLNSTNEIKHKTLSTNSNKHLILNAIGNCVVNMIHSKLKLYCLFNYLEDILWLHLFYFGENYKMTLIIF